MSSDITRETKKRGLFMAFDGIVISNITQELSRTLTGGRIIKISQPEKDELILTVKNYDTYKLFLSA